MSGLYNAIFGTNSAADAILATLKLGRSDFGRFRDAHVTNGEIAVYTRCGGGNRDDYQYVFDEAATHACYLRDEDDGFDSTYATIYFRFPDEYADDLRKLDSGEPFDPSARWLAAIEAIRGAK